MTDEERYAQSVLAPMREIREAPTSPATIDIGRAIVDGKRRIRIRRLAAVGAIAGVTAVVVVVVPLTAGALRQRVLPETGTSAPVVDRSQTPPTPDRSAGPARLPIDCTGQRLAVPDGVPKSITTGLDPTGRFILGRSYPGGAAQQVLIWENGTARRVDLPGVDQMLVDANPAGVAVGRSYRSGVLTSWVYDGRTATELRADDPAAPSAIGETGRIVGYREAGEGGRRPVVWASSTTTAADLPLPGPRWEGRAVDVAPDGTVVGVIHEVGTDVGREQGYVWAPDGTGRMVAPPVIDGVRADGFRPYAIGPEWITGVAVFFVPGTKSFRLQAARVNVRTGVGDRYPTTPDFVTSGADGSGWLAGQFDGPATLSDGGVTFLPRVSGLTAQETMAVSQDGRVVVGQGVDGQKRTRAVVWRCQ